MSQTNNLKNRQQKDFIFSYLFKGIIIFLFIILIWLISSILYDAWGWLNIDFIFKYISRNPVDAGVFQGLIGSLMLIVLVALFSMIIGVATAIYLEEYANKNSLLYKVVDVSISNLSGVPSIIYGILGMSIFSYLTYLKGSLLAGAITLSLLVLPVIIVSSQEALKAVPSSLKEAAYGLAMSKLQVISCVTLPYAIPGILTGSILALSRAIGEGAPLIVIGAATIMSNVPTSLTSSFTALPLQIFYWTAQPKADFQNVAAAASIVLIIILILMNSIAIIIRNKFSRK